MPNRFQVGAERLGQRLQTHVARAVTYVRGSVSIPLTVWASVHTYDVVGNDGSTLTFVKSHDFGFPAADLAASGLIPMEGDRLMETLDGTAIVYTVSAMDPRPCYEIQDGAGVLLLVHTKRTT
jgi:hypothetical protein